MSYYKYDKNKPIRKDWENLKVGDYVFDDVRGPATCNGVYGHGEKVIKITDKYIQTVYDGEYTKNKKSKWNIDTKYHIGPPTAYFLSYFQSN